MSGHLTEFARGELAERLAEVQRLTVQRDTVDIYSTRDEWDQANHRITDELYRLLGTVRYFVLDTP